MELQCKVQNYDWGKLGSDSAVAKFIKSADPSVSIDESKPYAELWLGTHPNGPSRIIERDELLSDYIKYNEDAIGPVVKKKFGVQVPFLLKVLSVRKALSLQAHPHKELAEELHKKFPEIYTDDNHKPEMAIALTPFEILCGFRPLQEIQDNIRNIPELRELLCKDSVERLLSHNGTGDNTQLLKPVFASLMTADKDAVADSLDRYLKRVDTDECCVVRRLCGWYGGEAGCWAALLLAHVTLAPGHAVFLGAGLPHAYISGDCIECMSRSDNIVRAGLTPKLVDVPTLLHMLDYSSYPRHELLLQPTLQDQFSCVWRPPVPDFAVAKIKVPSGESYNTKAVASCSLLIVSTGSGTACDTEPRRAKQGTAFFLKANRQLTLTSDDGEDLELYQAFCNL